MGRSESLPEDGGEGRRQGRDERGTTQSCQIRDDGCNGKRLFTCPIGYRFFYTCWSCCYQSWPFSQAQRGNFDRAIVDGASVACVSFCYFTSPLANTGRSMNARVSCVIRGEEIVIDNVRPAFIAALLIQQATVTQTAVHLWSLDDS